MNEALHMTNEEHDILVSLMRQIKDELQKNTMRFRMPSSWATSN